MVLNPVPLRDDLDDLARIDGHGNGILECSVNHGGNFPRRACTMRFVLTARGTHLGGDGYIFTHY